MNKYLETLSNLKDANKPVENNTELEKLQFNLQDDAKKALKEFSDLYNKYNNEIDQAYVHIRRMEKSAKEAKAYEASMKKAAQDLRKAEGNVEEAINKAKTKAKELSKELGIEADLSEIVNYSLYNNTVKLSDGLQKDADLFLKFMKKMPNFNL